MIRRRAVASLAIVMTLAAVSRAGDTTAASWSRWGGPNQDFRAPAEGLAASWPDDGPRKLWSRPLGDGYSAILFEDGRLYTMYRAGDEEAVVCLDAGTGETVWEHRYVHTPRDEHVRGFGSGPNATPLIAGDRLFTIGVSGRMHALSKSDGKVVWTRDLWDEELDGNFLAHGYSSSPVAYKENVIVAVGGEKNGLVAFDQASGKVKWTSEAFKNSYSSPRIVDIAGDAQLVTFTAEALFGLDPDSGKLRWRYDYGNPWGHNIGMPTIVGGDTVFLSSPQTGARGLQLARDGDTITAEEVWTQRRIQFYHGATARIGDWVYGSTGTSSPTFMAAVNIRTGEIGWRERGIARANCVEADGKLIILGEDGTLYLAVATPEKLVVHSKTQLLAEVAWTVPTIVGRVLYARDKTQIIAVDLG